MRHEWEAIKMFAMDRYRCRNSGCCAYILLVGWRYRRRALQFDADFSDPSNNEACFVERFFFLSCSFIKRDFGPRATSPAKIQLIYGQR